MYSIKRLKNSEMLKTTSIQEILTQDNKDTCSYSYLIHKELGKPILTEIAVLRMLNI
jgi:hypothetical protein